MTDRREVEIKQGSDALLSGESLLVTGDPGSGKSTLGEKVRSQLKASQYSVGMISYSGSAIDALKELCEQLGIATVADEQKMWRISSINRAIGQRGAVSASQILTTWDDLSLSGPD